MPEAFRDRLDALSASPPTSCGEALEALAELVALAHPSPGVDSGDELEEALDEATYWAGKLFDQCRAAAAALAWLPQSLAGGPVPTLRELARAASDGEAQAIARERIAELERLAHVAGQCAQMELDFLYDRGRHLLTIDRKSTRLNSSH